MSNNDIYFGIPLSFGEKIINNKINYYSKLDSPSYVCVVDFNVLANTYHNDDYKRIIRNATFNTCDGSLLAFMLNVKYGSKFSSYNGPEIFNKYIEDKNFKHLLLGPSADDFILLKEKLNNADNVYNMTLPFKDVDDFDYDFISNYINQLSPDLIWVMLGAPKQENFINILFPKVNRGVLLGTGAALNFYFGRLKNRKFEIMGLRFIWLERLFIEPSKQIKRIMNFLKVLPRILKDV